MRKLIGVLTLTVAVIALALPQSAFAWACYYCGPAWFSVGEYHTSNYDTGSFWWDGNRIYKSVSALGTITFIDTSGGWHSTVQDYRVDEWTFISPVNWVKKLLCKNSSSVGYSADCYGDY